MSTAGCSTSAAWARASTADDGFSEECISMMNRRNVNITKADTYDWVLTIPKAELDANPNINEEDQNP